MRGPFNVPAPAQAAGVAALADRAHLARPRAHNDRWLPWLGGGADGARPAADAQRRQFRAGALPGDPALTADGGATFLNGRGILPRQMGAYGLPDCLRITIGLDDEKQAVARRCADFAAPHGAVDRAGAR